MVRKSIIALVAFVMSMFSALSTRLGAAVLDGVAAFDESLGRMTEAKAMRMAATTDRGQLGLGTILAAFTVVIAAFVVLIVVDQFDQSFGTPSASSLSTAQNDLLSGFGSMISLIEPLLLIAIGVVIIGLIRRVQ